MKKTPMADASSAKPDDLKPEYDFDYQKARPNRFTDRVDRDRVVVTLDPDVSQVFTTQESVNEILRALIQSMPNLHPSR